MKPSSAETVAQTQSAAHRIFDAIGQMLQYECRDNGAMALNVTFSVYINLVLAIAKQNSAALPILLGAMEDSATILTTLAGADSVERLEALVHGSASASHPIDGATVKM